MFCDVRDVIEQHRQYARGWIRLFEHLNTQTTVEMQRYAENLEKLKQEHEIRCWICSQKEKHAEQG